MSVTRVYITKAVLLECELGELGVAAELRCGAAELFDVL